MKVGSWLLIGLLFLLITGCATAPAGPPKPPAVDVTGVWEGSWFGSYGRGEISLTLQQTGAKVEGEMRLSAGPPELRSARVDGAVAGSDFNFTSEGSFRAYLTVKGNEMSGPFTYQYSNQMTLRRKK